jgi:uncharacterized membrane protein YoaK (UPF0700 family)
VNRTLAIGALGFTGNLTLAAVSAASAEQWTRIGAHAAGIAVALVTIYTMLARHFRHARRDAEQARQLQRDADDRDGDQ